jgi:hypothetical protein
MALAAAILTQTSTAQTFQFTIDQANSNYTWSGTTSLGPLLGNPNNTFQLSGTSEFDLETGGSPVGSGSWVSANALVSPDLAGKVPNPIPGFPDLATVDVAGLIFSISTGNFAVNAAGNFNTTSTLSVIAGTLTVTPFIGSQTVTDLAGTVGPPSALSGTIQLSGNTMVFTSPMNTQFDFTDPTSGVSATMVLVGNMRATYDCQAPTNYCTGNPNSVGSGSNISATGSTSMTTNTFGLVAPNCPANKPGLFFTGPNQANIPLGNGVLCISGAIQRFDVLFSSGSGVYTMPVDFNNLPGSLSISAGSSWNYQCWYRDVAAGGSGYNLSSALNVTYCP